MLIVLSQSLVGTFELREYSEGMVIAWAGEVDDCMYVIKSGQCLLTTAVTPAQRQALQDQNLQGSAKLPRVQGLGGEKLEAGARHGEQSLLTAQARATTLVASKDGTQASAICSCFACCAKSQLLYIFKHSSSSSSMDVMSLYRF